MTRLGRSHFQLKDLTPLALEVKPYSHTLHLVLGSHVHSEAEFNARGNMWSDEVIEQVERLQTHQIVPDSLNCFAYISYLKAMIPLRNPGNSFPDREALYVVGADIIIPREKDDVRARIWEIFAENDPILRKLLYDSKPDQNKVVSDEVLKRYVCEGSGVLLGIVVLLALVNQLRQARFTRRTLLKIGIVGLLTVVLKSGLGYLLLGAMDSNTKPEANQVYMKVMEYLDPVFFRSALIELRNIKLGLAAYDNARRIKSGTNYQGEFVSVIPVGSLHSMETDPTSSEEYLLKRLKSHLETIYRYLPDVLGKNYDGKTEHQIRNLFTGYIAYKIPQNQNGRCLVNSATFHVIDKADKLFKEVFLTSSRSF